MHSQQQLCRAVRMAERTKEDLSLITAIMARLSRDNQRALDSMADAMDVIARMADTHDTDTVIRVPTMPNPTVLFNTECERCGNHTMITYACHGRKVCEGCKNWVDEQGHDFPPGTSICSACHSGVDYCACADSLMDALPLPWAEHENEDIIVLAEASNSSSAYVAPTQPLPDDSLPETLQSMPSTLSMGFESQVPFSQE